MITSIVIEKATDEIQIPFMAKNNNNKRKEIPWWSSG